MNYHQEHGVKHVTRKFWVNGEEHEEIVPNLYEYNPPKAPEGDDRLTDFSLFAGGEVGLGLYEATIQSPRRSGKDHLNAMETMTVQDTVQRGDALFRAIPDVTTNGPWFLGAGSLKKAFPGCPDYAQLKANLKTVGCPDIQTFRALAEEGWNRVSQLAYALTYEIAESGPEDQPVCIVDDNRLFGEPEEEDEFSPDNPATLEAPPMFMRYVRMSHFEPDTAHDKGLPNPPWFKAYKRAKYFQTRSLTELSKIQKAFRDWYEPRKSQTGYSSIAKAFWPHWYEIRAELSADAMSDEVVSWIKRLQEISTDQLKYAGSCIGNAIREGRFNENQGALLWKAWHRRNPPQPKQKQQ